jgi:tRNA-binding EMAP/Myf-like protein
MISRKMTGWMLAGILSVSLAAQAAGPLPSTVTGVASEGLVLLATTGNPDPLQKELGGNVVPSSDLEKKLGAKTMATLLTLDKGEHLAPKGLIAPTGEWYNMVAPTITKDNFILVDKTGAARRMSVGAVAGDRRPTVVVDADTADLPATVTGVASQGLILLATTGNPDPLQKEIGGKIVPSSELEAKIGPKAMASLLKLDKKEHLAPKSLIAPTGEWYNMVAPTITKDNFILVDKTGVPRRLSVGAVAGTNRPSIVAHVEEDGGTPWYVEFWYWIRIHLTGK